MKNLIMFFLLAAAIHHGIRKILSSLVPLMRLNPLILQHIIDQLPFRRQTFNKTSIRALSLIPILGSHQTSYDAERSDNYPGSYFRMHNASRY
jgi:hypothetical protein